MDDQPPSVNQTMLEGFEWYTPGDAYHWKRLQRVIPELKAIGIDSIWIPPGCKAGWHQSNGYDTYDLYDVGEFDQKGSIATKWGTKQDLLSMMNVAKAAGVEIYWDAVLNHKASADYTEICTAIKVDYKNRKKEIGGPLEVEVWSGYNFPGRNGRYSSMHYNWHHFSGTDYDERSKNKDCIYRFLGDGKLGWAEDVDEEDGNADYLMFNDLDFSNKEVRDDLLHWGEWIVSELGLSGFRLDAVKHFSQAFLKSWIANLDRKLGRQLFMVGEYWSGETKVLARMIENFSGRLHLFDVALVGNFDRLSRSRNGDMRTILEGTLIERCPQQAVTFVQNHDTQDRFERDHEVSPVAPWFIPLAYAFILLRANSGIPCTFYGDFYGTRGPKPQPPTCNGKLPVLTMVRKLYAYGEQKEYLDNSHCIGFTRLGHVAHSGGAGLAVIMSNSDSYCFKKMFVGKHHADELWTDVMKFAWGTVTIDDRGWGTFPVGPRSVGVWVNSQAAGRNALEDLDFNDMIYDRAPQSIVVRP